MVLLLSAKLPMALLLFLLLLRRAETPTATLLKPAVLFRSASKPKAVLEPWYCHERLKTDARIAKTAGLG